MEYTRESLSKMNLTNVRQIGRNVGVKSPTSKTKEQLINDIIDVLSGKVAPHFAKVGRPPIVCENVEPPKKEEKKFNKADFFRELNILINEFKKNVILLLDKHAD